MSHSSTDPDPSSSHEENLEDEPDSWSGPSENGSSPVSVLTTDIRVAPFVSKLYDIANKFPELCSFCEDGENVIVHDSARLEKEVLPLYFRHGNYRTLVRQLNLYCFRKVWSRARIAYCHPLFKKGQPETLYLIERQNAAATSTTKKDVKKSLKAEKAPSSEVPFKAIAAAPRKVVATAAGLPSWIHMNFAVQQDQETNYQRQQRLHKERTMLLMMQLQQNHLKQQRHLQRQLEEISNRNLGLVPTNFGLGGQRVPSEEGGDRRGELSGQTSFLGQGSLHGGPLPPPPVATALATAFSLPHGSSDGSNVDAGPFLASHQHQKRHRQHQHQQILRSGLDLFSEHREDNSQKLQPIDALSGFVVLPHQHLPPVISPHQQESCQEKGLHGHGDLPQWLLAQHGSQGLQQHVEEASKEFETTFGRTQKKGNSSPPSDCSSSQSSPIQKKMKITQAPSRSAASMAVMGLLSLASASFSNL